MKKIFFFLSFILLLNVKSHSQTQFPFKGFELSNYEVGDSIEYAYSSWNYSQQNCGSSIFYTFINKEITTGNDSVKFTLKRIYNNSGQYCGPPWGGSGTIQIIIPNDTVYNNNNNLLGVFLYQFNNDTTLINPPYDSSYVLYDTLAGLKRLKAQYLSSWFIYQYDAFENLGIINYSDASEDIFVGNHSYTLQYAHLAHFGVYGTYIPVIYDGIDDELTNENSISISPNPFTNQLSIDINAAAGNALLQVCNLIGQVVYEETVTVNGNALHRTLDLSFLASGVYILKTVTPDGAFAQKVVRE